MKCILSWGNQIVALLHYSWNGIFVAHFVPGATAPVANWPSILQPLRQVVLLERSQKIRTDKRKRYGDTLALLRIVESMNFVKRVQSP